MAFPERLKRLRSRAGITQEQAATHIGVGRSTYSKYETGDSEPSHDILRRLADFFDCTMDYLLGRSEKPLSQSDSIKHEVSVPPEQADFLKWVEDNLEGTFFYDFHKSPVAQKEEMMEILRMVWELQKKRQEKRAGKD